MLRPKQWATTTTLSSMWLTSLATTCSRATQCSIFRIAVHSYMWLMLTTRTMNQLARNCMRSSSVQVRSSLTFGTKYLSTRSTVICSWTTIKKSSASTPSRLTCVDSFKSLVSPSLLPSNWPVFMTTLSTLHCRRSSRNCCPKSLSSHRWWTRWSADQKSRRPSSLTWSLRSIFRRTPHLSICNTMKSARSWLMFWSMWPASTAMMKRTEANLTRSHHRSSGWPMRTTRRTLFSTCERSTSASLLFAWSIRARSIGNTWSTITSTALRKV